MSFEYWIKALESFKCFKPVLFLMLIRNWYFASYGSLVYQWTFTIPGFWVIRLKTEFIFPDFLVQHALKDLSWRLSRSL